MQEVITQFFDRFRSDVTQSIYAVKGIDDYHRLKTFYDYLDYDRSSIFRKKQEILPCGLRNIGNTCYLNVFLQILYHINFLREKIFALENSKSNVIQQLKILFARMQLGKLSYVDPIDLFEELKKIHPDVFVQGMQNDFHQICTIILNQLKESFKGSQTDQKVIEKILFGKISVKTYHSEGKSTRNTRFNLINLNVAHDSLQKALENWKNYQIEDYLTDNNKIVKARVENEFIQTPALLTFFINRVYFKDGKLHKDCRQFKFENIIELQKSSSSSGGSKPTIKPEMKRYSLREEQLLEQKQKLYEWTKTITKKKQYLKQALRYIEQKQFTNINVPSIENEFDELSPEVKAFLQEQIRLIDAKIVDTQKEIISMEDKMKQLCQQSEVELYQLWGMMIHEGTDSGAGHYKVLLQTEPDCWVEFNDRNVYKITNQKIDIYKLKGNICCLFYKRSSLSCTNKKVPISGQLKNRVNEIEKKIILQIDKARVLQNLYQLNQSSGYLVQQEMKDKQQNEWIYFFKPILHCLEEKYTFSQCQGILTYENLKDTTNIEKLQSSFISDCLLQIPDLSLQIPSEYFKYATLFQTFIRKEIIFESIGDAYEWLAGSICIPVKNKTVLKWIEKYLEVIVMKGVFYLCVYYRASPNPLIQDKFAQLYKALQKILRRMNSTSNFVLTYIPIKDEVLRLFTKKNSSPLMKEKSQNSVIMLKPASNVQISKLLSESGGQLFMKRFGYWIDRVKEIMQIDESIIEKEYPLQKQFLIQMN